MTNRILPYLETEADTSMIFYEGNERKTLVRGLRVAEVPVRSACYTQALGEILECKDISILHVVHNVEMEQRRKILESLSAVEGYKRISASRTEVCALIRFHAESILDRIKTIVCRISEEAYGSIPHAKLLIPGEEYRMRAEYFKVKGSVVKSPAQHIVGAINNLWFAGWNEKDIQRSIRWFADNELLRIGRG